MKLHDFLNERISDFALLYFKLHRFHWFVEGSGFFPFHTKYEELYDEMTELLDEYAERLLSIGGTPFATIKQYLATSKLSEDGTEVEPKAIGNTIIKDFSAVVLSLKDGIKIAEDHDDDTTADMFITTISSLEKHIWMFKQSVK